MAKKRRGNKMARGILVCILVMLLGVQLGAVAEGISEEAVFTKNGVMCDAFWPGNTISLTAQITSDGSFDKAWVLMALKSNGGKKVEQIALTPVAVKAGINVVKGSIAIPENTNGDSLDAYCLKEGKLGALTLKNTISKGTGTEPVQKYTAVDPEAWGFETNSLGGEDDGKDWSIYEIARRSGTSYCGIANTISISKGAATLVSIADTGEAANVKDGAYAAKLVGNVNTVTNGAVTAMSFVGIGKGYAQLSANSGKQHTIEGYMKITSLASDARVRLVMRKGHQKAETREISDADLLFMGSNTQGFTIGEWLRVQFAVPTVQEYDSIFLGLELVGEGTVYFDGFRLLEDTNLVTNGSFAIGKSNNLAANYQRTIYGWSAQQGTDNSTDSYKYNYKYDPAYACAFHTGGVGVTGYLYQNANAFNTMVHGKTYDISLAYSGTGTPQVVIGEETVTLTDSGETAVRGTGTAEKTFKIYTGEYALAETAAIPAEYKVTSKDVRSLPEYFADFSIYPR